MATLKELAFQLFEAEKALKVANKKFSEAVVAKEQASVAVDNAKKAVRELVGEGNKEDAAFSQDATRVLVLKIGGNSINISSLELQA